MTAFRRSPDPVTQDAHHRLQDPRRSDLSREIGIRWAGDRDELSARLQHSQGFLERLAAEAIQDHVITVQELFEVVFPVVDDNICTEALDQIGIRRAGCRGYRRADVLRQLNRECAYTAGASVDENFLPLLQIPSFDQRLPGV